MKARRSLYCKQHGATLIEVLVALILFSIIIVGSGTLLTQMLRTQKQMQVQSVIINLMQTRLQDALGSPGSTNVCTAIAKTTFSLDSKTFYIGCATETIIKDTVSTTWPVLAASTVSQDDANACANGTLTNTCYVVGK